MNHLIPTRLAAALAAFLLATPVLADSVRLRASVRLPAGATDIRLEHIATLDGEAVQYADLLIAPLDDSEPVTEIPIAVVQEKLDAAGVHWGRINLSGRKVLVRRRGGSTNMLTAMKTVSLAPARPREAAARERDDVGAASLINQPTIRGEIARTIIRAHGAEPRNVRILSDRRDAALLDRTISGRPVQVTAESGLRSDRVTFSIREWTDAVSTTAKTVSVHVLLNVPTVVLESDIARHDVIDEGDLRREIQWLRPSQAAIAASPGATAGRVASQKLHAGEIVRSKHVRRETVIQRGDRVTVRCLVGGIVVKLTAIAREGGARGDTIQCQKPGERQTFAATVAGRGEAIVDLSKAPLTGQRSASTGANPR